MKRILFLSKVLNTEEDQSRGYSEGERVYQCHTLASFDYRLMVVATRKGIYDSSHVGPTIVVVLVFYSDTEAGTHTIFMVDEVWTSPMVHKYNF